MFFRYFFIWFACKWDSILDLNLRELELVSVSPVNLFSLVSSSDIKCFCFILGYLSLEG